MDELDLEGLDADPATRRALIRDYFLRRKKFEDEDKGYKDQQALGGLASSLSQASSSIGQIGGRQSAPLKYDTLAPMIESQKPIDTSKESLDTAKLYSYLKDKNKPVAAPKEGADWTEAREPDAQGYPQLFNKKTSEFKRAPYKIGAKPEKEKPVLNYDDRINKMNASEKIRYDNSVEAMDAVRKMSDALNSGDNTFSTIGDNKFTAARKNYEEAFGRMQSGGVIGPQEAEEFRKMVPTFTDSASIQREKLQNMEIKMKSRLDSLGFNPDEAMSRFDKNRSTYVSSPEKQAETKMVGGKKYKKVSGGWEEIE